MSDELQHYGVVGMKWGVRRARYKSSRNDNLRAKALSYDKKAAALSKKSEKLHAKKDLEGSNKKAVKAASYEKKSAVAAKKANKASNDLTRAVYEKRSAKMKYKASKARIDGDRMSRTAAYGAEAMKYAVKSDKVAKKAAKARMKIANNNAYMAKLDRKISEISKEDLRGAYAFVNEYKSGSKNRVQSEPRSKEQQSIDLKYSKKRNAAKTQDEKERIELEWMDALDELDKD